MRRKRKSLSPSVFSLSLSLSAHAFGHLLYQWWPKFWFQSWYRDSTITSVRFRFLKESWFPFYQKRKKRKKQIKHHEFLLIASIGREQRDPIFHISWLTKRLPFWLSSRESNVLWRVLFTTSSLPSFSHSLSHTGKHTHRTVICGGYLGISETGCMSFSGKNWKMNVINVSCFWSWIEFWVCGFGFSRPLIWWARISL